MIQYMEIELTVPEEFVVSFQKIYLIQIIFRSQNKKDTTNVRK